MKKARTSTKVLCWFVTALVAFAVLRLLLPGDYATMVAAIPGVIFTGYMANLGAQMVRNPPAVPPREPDTNRDGTNGPQPPGAR